MSLVILPFLTANPRLRRTPYSAAETASNGLPHKMPCMIDKGYSTPQVVHGDYLFCKMVQHILILIDKS